MNSVEIELLIGSRDVGRVMASFERSVGRRRIDEENYPGSENVPRIRSAWFIFLVDILAIRQAERSDRFDVLFPWYALSGHTNALGLARRKGEAQSPGGSNRRSGLYLREQFSCSVHLRNLPYSK
jgi:hypothetical protein